MRLVTTLVTIAFGIVAATPALADHLVIQVSGPVAKVYPVGTCLPTGARPVLAPEDRIVMVDDSGTTVWSGKDAAQTGKRREMGATRGMRLPGADPCAAWRSTAVGATGTSLASR